MAKQVKKNPEEAPQMQAAPVMPEGVNIEGLGNEARFDDFPPDDATLSPEEKAEQQRHAQAIIDSYNATTYVPAPDVIKRLNEFPKDEVKQETGIDLDYLIKTTKKKGLLEALAYGTFTPPMRIYVRRGHEKPHSELATVRMWVIPAQEGRELKWNYDTHNVLGLQRKLDENGQPIYKNGEPVLTYNRNPLKPGDILSYNGVELKPEQVDRLRLTGNLGEPLPGLDFNNKPMYTVLSVDPYNNHELIGVKSSSIADRLSKIPEYKYRDKDGVEHHYPLNERSIGELSLGRGVWLKPQNPSDKDIYVQYNAAFSCLTRATSYEQAKRKEREIKHDVEQTRNLERQQTQELAPGMHL